MIAFSGVRSSWLMLARKCDFLRTCLHGCVACHLHSPQQLGQLGFAPLLRRDVDVDAGDRDDAARAVHHREPHVGEDVFLATANDLRLAPVRLAGSQHDAIGDGILLGRQVISVSAATSNSVFLDAVVEEPEVLVLAVHEDETAVEVAEVDGGGHVVDQGPSRLLGSLTLDDAPELRADAQEQLEEVRVDIERLVEKNSSTPTTVLPAITGTARPARGRARAIRPRDGAAPRRAESLATSCSRGGSSETTVSAADSAGSPIRSSLVA